MANDEYDVSVPSITYYLRQAFYITNPRIVIVSLQG